MNRKRIIDISRLSLAELLDLGAAVEARIRDLEDDHVAETYVRMQEVAAGIGMTPAEVIERVNLARPLPVQRRRTAEPPPATKQGPRKPVAAHMTTLEDFRVD